MIGAKSVAEVYRTFDKLAIRKEYHEALLRHGMDLDAIVAGIKQIADSSEEDAVKLNAYKIFLKSLGLDEYKESDHETKENWEDLIRNSGVEKPKQIIEGKYEVIEPVVPEDVKQRQIEEKETGKNLYE
jgi:hypothetical protein